MSIGDLLMGRSIVSDFRLHTVGMIALLSGFLPRTVAYESDSVDPNHMLIQAPEDFIRDPDRKYRLRGNGKVMNNLMFVAAESQRDLLDSHKSPGRCDDRLKWRIHYFRGSYYSIETALVALSARIEIRS